MAKVQNIKTVYEALVNHIETAPKTLLKEGGMRTIVLNKVKAAYHQIERDDVDLKTKQMSEAYIRNLASLYGVVDGYITEAPVAERKEALKTKDKAEKASKNQRKNNKENSYKDLRKQAEDICIARYGRDTIILPSNRKSAFGKGVIEYEFEQLKKQFEQRGNNLGVGDGFVSNIEENNKSYKQKKEEKIKKTTVKDPIAESDALPDKKEGSIKVQLLFIDKHLTSLNTPEEYRGWVKLIWRDVETGTIYRSAYFENEPDDQSYTPERDEAGNEIPNPKVTCSCASVAQRIIGYYYSTEDTPYGFHVAGEPIESALNFVREYKAKGKKASETFEWLRDNEVAVRADVVYNEYKDEKYRLHFTQYKKDTEDDAKYEEALRQMEPTERHDDTKLGQHDKKNFVERATELEAIANFC